MDDRWKPDDETLQFLLGELAEADRQRIEDRCLADDAFFESVDRAEEWLAAGYADGTLDAGLRQRFEARIQASPRRTARVRLEQLLQRHAGSEGLAGIGEPAGAEARDAVPVRAWNRRPPFRLALAAAAGLAAVALAATFFFVNQGLRDRLARAESDLARAREQVGALEHSARTGGPGGFPAGGGELMPGAVAARTLEPGVLRGEAGAQRLALGAGVRLVWLRLLVAAPGESVEYRVVARTPEGKELARFDRLASCESAEGTVVDVALPSALLPPGTTCLLRLEGLDARGGAEDMGTYVVEISR